MSGNAIKIKYFSNIFGKPYNPNFFVYCIHVEYHYKTNKGWRVLIDETHVDGSVYIVYTY